MDSDRGFGESEFATLSPEEQRRGARLRNEADRVAFTVTRAALRAILSETTGVAASDLEFRPNAWGKLSLADEAFAEIDFSVSHTRSLSVIALSHGCSVGVDVEASRACPDRHRIAADVFGADAARRLNDAENADLLFLEMWTAAEAFLKAQGTGFGGATGTVPIFLSGSRDQPRIQLDERRSATTGWKLSRLSLPAGFVGHVVCGKTPAQKHLLNLRDDIQASVVYALT